MPPILQFAPCGVQSERWMCFCFAILCYAVTAWFRIPPWSGGRRRWRATPITLTKQHLNITKQHCKTIKTCWSQRMCPGAFDMYIVHNILYNYVHYIRPSREISGSFFWHQRLLGTSANFLKSVLLPSAMQNATKICWQNRQARSKDVSRTRRLYNIYLYPHHLKG